ncbi:hypothetical protein QE152_g30568 [Popillia japonica]|uniref:Uncharacterized protein n=1 Tax=Popillia japonica TaxID=7064 RepID=A0AAW1JE09_POPJA
MTDDDKLTVRKQKTKSPSRIKRNQLRAEAYRERMLQQRHAVNTELPPTEPPPPHNGLPKPSKGLQAYRERMLQQRHAVNTELPPTEPPPPHNGLPKPSKGLRKKVGQLTKLFKGLATGDDGKTDTIPVPTQIRPPANSPVTSTLPPDTINENGDNRDNGTNITNIYNGIEMSMRLRRLEDVPILTAALRQLIRTLHLKGDTITFPCPEAVDRIHLKSNGLPTKSAE